MYIHLELSLLSEVVLSIVYEIGCPDLEDIKIEDYNFVEVSSFTLDATMRGLKDLVLGTKVFSLCTDIYLRGLCTEGC